MTSIFEQFTQQGFVVLHRLFEPSSIEKVRQECAVIVDELATEMLNEGKISKTYKNDPLEMRLIRLYQEHPEGKLEKFIHRQLHREEFFELFSHPTLLELAQEIFGSEIRLYPGSSIRAKFPDDESSLVTWHQDFGLRNDHTFQLLNVWAPLVPVNQKIGSPSFFQYKKDCTPTT